MMRTHVISGASLTNCLVYEFTRLGISQTSKKYKEEIDLTVIRQVSLFHFRISFPIG